MLFLWRICPPPRLKLPANQVKNCLCFTYKMADENNAMQGATGVANGPDLSDEEMVVNFCLQHKISRTAIDELLKRGYTSLEALSLVDMSDLVSPRIPKGQRRLIFHIAEALKVKTTSRTSRDTAVDQGANSAEAVETGTDTSVEPQSSDRQAVPAISLGTANNGVNSSATNNAADIYQQLLREQQGLSASTCSAAVAGPSMPPQASWSDPQIHLSSAAGKSVSNHLDICDFVQGSIEEEVVLGGEGEKQVVIKSGPKKPRLENLTLSQWSVANLAILYRLVGENKLQGPALMDYLSYTTKVYQLVQRYSLVSVLHYDREYRKLQGALRFRWGTDVQHLSNIHLQARDRPVVPGGQQKKMQIGTKPGRQGRNKPEVAVCRNYNSQKGCSFSDCKFRHVCIIPGCGQSHSAINHATEK